MKLTVLSDAVSTVHRTWQLVLMQFAFIFISFFSFFLFVGIPIAIAFILFGLDLTDIMRAREVSDILSVFRGAGDALTKYIGIAIFVMFGLLIYFSFLVILWVFMFGGAIGVLGKAITDPEHRFSVRDFAAEGRRRFAPVFIYSNVVGLGFLFLAFMIGVIGDGAARIIELAQQQEATLAYFLAIFFRLVLLSVGLVLLLLPLSVTFYGFAAMAFHNTRPIATLKITLSYLHDRPGAFGFLGIVLLGYIAVGALAMLIGAGFAVLPVVGTLLSIPCQIVTQAAHAYASILMVTVLFHYYLKTGGPSPEIPSTPPPDISPQPDVPQEPVPQEMAAPQPAEPETPPQSRL